MPSPAPERVALSLGANLGADPPAQLRAALDRLAAAGAFVATAVSPVYRTAPWGPVPQADFANCCALGHSPLAPDDLLAAAKSIEWAMGRRPGPRWGPRAIDIDIVAYGERVLQTATLTLPHPEAARRAFVLVPLAAIAPDLRLGGRRVDTLAAACGSAGVVPWQQAPGNADSP